MKLIGFCGLPNSGKSTFFRLLSKLEVEIAKYPFTTKKPKEAKVPIFTEELLKLHSVTKTKEIIPPYLNFLDVPGLIRGSHKGLGLGNEFLSYLRGCDIILEIVRNFEKEDVPHPEGNVDPERDILIIEEEIIKADEKIINENLKKLKKANIEKEKINALEEILQNLKPFSRFQKFNDILKEYNLLVIKDWYIILNGEREFNIERLKNLCFKNIYKFDFEFELELENEEELKSEYGSKLEEFLKKFRKDIGLIQFFTFTKDITQGWFIEDGSSILKCANMIHSDFEKKFKYAEVIELKNFLESRGFDKKDIKTVGKDYIVKDCEIIKIFI